MQHPQKRSRTRTELEAVVGPFRKEGDVAKTHFVILLFSPLTATDSGEGKERETRQIRTPKDETRAGGGEKLNWRTFAPLLLLGVSVFQ